MTYVFGDFELDPRLFQLRHAGEIVKLEPKIFDVLVYLIRHRSRVVSKDELLDSLWPGEFVSESVLPRCIAGARKALGETRLKPAAIATVHGRGYRFVAEVQQLEAETAGHDSAPVDGETERAPIFVGREDILTRMRAALTSVYLGRSRMILLVGEPGIGKTRTAEELAADARRRGARVVSARCHDGEGAPAFWPWAQLLRGTLRGLDDPRTVRRKMGEVLADLAYLVPDLAEPSASLAGRDRLRPPTQTNPGDVIGTLDEARFQMFDAVAAFLRHAAGESPLLLLLDDLHWADRPSLLLLQYLAREVREGALLIVATYRDVELRRQHPLVSVLGELAREPTCERLHLRGWNESEVSCFLRARLDRSSSERFVSAVHAMTEGNPFFVNEVVGLLEAEGRLSAGNEPEVWDILLPQSVREAIGRRLDALSPSCNRILTAASVIGRDFDVVLLQKVAAAIPGQAATGDLSLLECLDEAVSAQILTAESPALGLYSFSHALVRQTLYEELSIPLRLRLHLKAAEAMQELHAADLDEHLSQIAHHFYEGAAAGNADEAIDYSIRTARRAFASLAYEEAAVHYERALQLLDCYPAANSAELRCETLLDLAEAQAVSGIREKSQENCRRAAAAARQLVRPDLLARAALGFGQRTEAGPLPAQELRDLLEEALASLGDKHLALRSRVLSRLQATPPYQDSMETRASMSREAVDLARRAGDRAALFEAQAAKLWALLGPDHDEERLREVESFTRLIEQNGGEREPMLVALEHRARTFLAYGDLARADAETQTYEKIATELRQPSFLLFAKWYWIARALCDGRFVEAEAQMRESYAYGKRIQHPASAGILLWQIFWSLREKGDLARFEEAAQEIFRFFGDVPQLDLAAGSALERGADFVFRQYAFEGAFVPATVAYVHHQSGRTAEARATFEQLAARDFGDVPRDEWWMPTTTLLAEVAADLGDAHRCGALLDLLEPFAARNAAHALLRTYGGSVAYFLGRLLAALGRVEEATRHYETAIERNTAMGARPALLRTQYHFGRLLGGRGRRSETKRGGELLRLAARSATEIGLERVAKRIQKEIIKSS